MIQFDIRAHQEAIESLKEMENTLERECDVQIVAVDQTKGVWEGRAAEQFRTDYGNMLLYGEYEQTLQQIKDMRYIMTNALSEMEYLKNKCENFYNILTGEEPIQWSLGMYGSPSSLLMADYDVIRRLCMEFDDLSEAHRKACNALEDIIDQCGGIINFEAEREALYWAKKKIDRVETLRDEMNIYAHRMVDLDKNLSIQYSKWIDEDILAKVESSGNIQTTLSGQMQSIKTLQKLADEKSFSEVAIRYLAQTYGISTTASDINWEELALAAYADILNKNGDLTLAEKEILAWGDSQFALYDICVNGTDKERYEQTVALLGQESWTKIELSVLCACLDSYASLRDHEKLQELGASLLGVTYETRQNANGEITLYTVSVDEDMLQTLLEGAQALGATNLYSYLSAFEDIRIPQVQTKDAQECHFFFQMVDGKDGACEFALCIESDLEGGQVAMGYQSDMGVSQLTEEELRKVNSGLENHLFYERWFDESKEEEYCYKQRIEDVLRQINRANIAQVIEENGMAEYLPYLFGDMPYLDAEGEAQWNKNRVDALKRVGGWTRQGIDMVAVENYYYYLCGLETIAASAMRAEEDGFGSSIESFMLKYIGSMASNAYEQACYITGMTIDKDIAWYTPEKKAEAIRTTVGGNLEESVGGTAGELLGNTYQGVMSVGDGVISIGMDAIIGASIAEVLSGVGKVTKVCKTATAKEGVEELAEDTVQRTIQKNVKANFENEIPYDGNDWYEYLKKLYGDDNVVWESKGGGKTIDDIIDNLSETTNGKGVARNFESTGGFDQTIKDFDSLNPIDVKEIQTQYGPGKVGKLSDGTTIVARPGSTTGGATLEIRVSNSKVYKIRY